MSYTKTVVAGASFCTQSGQIIFRVKDTTAGPKLTIHSTSNGNQRSIQEYFLNEEALVELAEMFGEAANHEYTSKPHRNQATPPGSLVQGDIDDFGECTEQGNLDIWYSSQFVQNEKTSVSPGTELTSIYAPVEHTPVTPGTMTGTIYCDNVPDLNQVFEVSSSGEFTFKMAKLGNDGKYTYEKMSENALPLYVKSGTLNKNTGEFTLTWNFPPEKNHCIICYEYDMEITHG